MVKTLDGTLLDHPVPPVRGSLGGGSGAPCPFLFIKRHILWVSAEKRLVSASLPGAGSGPGKLP